jgi:hypothetical protein
MADISTDQLNAISQLLATQQQGDNANQKLNEEISSLGSLVNQERQKSSNDAEIASAISKYKSILGDIDKTSGILNRNEVPMGFFESLVRGAESGPNPLSNPQRLDYLNKLKSLQEQKEIAAQNLKAYLPAEPEKARPAVELQAPQQAPATSQPTQAAGKAEDGIPVVKAERLTPFDEFNILSDRKKQFLADSLQKASSLPPRVRDQAFKFAQQVAEETFKLPDNVARPVVDAATGQVIPGWRKVGDRLEKMESGKDTDKEEERMRELGVPGVGIARTVQEAKDLRAAQVSKKNADGMIDQLIGIANKPGAAFNLQDRAAANQIKTMLQGALRLQIVGPGAVTDADRAVLDSVIANPAQFFSLKGNVLNALNNLKRVNQQNLENMYESGIYKRFEQPQGQQQQQSGQGGGGRMIYDYTSKKFIQPK